MIVLLLMMYALSALGISLFPSKLTVDTGTCILQFWNYKASLQKCKCPICSCLISKLTPEACLLSRQEKEVTEVLENVHRYNRLFEGGVCGLVQTIVTGAGDETLRFWNIFPSMKLRAMVTMKN